MTLLSRPCGEGCVGAGAACELKILRQGELYGKTSTSKPVSKVWCILGSSLDLEGESCVREGLGEFFKHSLSKNYRILHEITEYYRILQDIT